MPWDVLEPGLRVIVAPNPSPMTERGTNTYLIGTTDLAVIDPGPQDEAHLQEILRAVEPGQRITHILVTHSHIDHSPLAKPLSEITGVPVMGAGSNAWGRSPLMKYLAEDGVAGGGEGVDIGFLPDLSIAEGDVIEAEGWQIEVLQTPGHMANHLSFVWNGALFSGDVVMGWSTSLISPPDGDMSAFYETLDRLKARDDRIYYPGHGAPVQNPQSRCMELIAHRRMREGAILKALADGPADAPTLARRVYTETPEALIPAAERNVLAHLLDLERRNEVTALDRLSATAVFRID